MSVKITGKCKTLVVYMCECVRACLRALCAVVIHMTRLWSAQQEGKTDGVWVYLQSQTTVEKNNSATKKVEF